MNKQFYNANFKYFVIFSILLQLFIVTSQIESKIWLIKKIEKMTPFSR